MTTKQCTKCGRELPLDEFYRQTGYKDGHRRECKHCTIEQQMRHRKDDPDYQVTHHTGKRPKDMTPEEQREYNRQYHRRYRETHRDRVRQISRESIARARAGEPKRKRGPVKGAEPKPMPKPSTFSLGRKKPVKTERACLRCIHYPCFDGIENFVTDFATEGCHGYKQKGQAI